MKKIYIALLTISILFAACKKDNTQPEILAANFIADYTIIDEVATINLNNTSEYATSYSWSFPGGFPENSTEENPTVSYTENGTYSITLDAINATGIDSKTIDITIDSIPDNGYIPYRYLENDGIFMFYETDNADVYESLIPNEFEMPSRMVIFAFFNDFYKLDYGATPYKENAISILVEYQGEEFFHCVYMPVTDEHSMWAGIIGLGLPKTMGEINFTRNDPVYYGDCTIPIGGTMNMSIDTEDFTIDNNTKQEMIDLQQLRSLQIRNENIVIVGNTGGTNNSVIQTAEQFPNLITLEFGEPTISTNTDGILFKHPLDLTPSNIIGGFYLKNTIPFGLTGDPL